MLLERSVNTFTIRIQKALEEPRISFSTRVNMTPLCTESSLEKKKKNQKRLADVRVELRHQAGDEVLHPLSAQSPYQTPQERTGGQAHLG